MINYSNFHFTYTEARKQYLWALSNGFMIPYIANTPLGYRVTYTDTKNIGLTYHDSKGQGSDLHHS